MPRRRRITVIGRDGKKTRVEENSHLKELYFERKFGSSFKEPSISNYSNESNGWYHDAKVERGESTNSEDSYTNSQRSKRSEGSFNNTISNRENSNIVSNNSTPNLSENTNSPPHPRKKKNRKSRRKGKHTQNQKTRRQMKKNKRKEDKKKTQKRNAQIRRKKKERIFNSNQ